MIVPSVGEIGIMFLPRIDDRQARVARRFKHARNWVNDALDGHDVDAGTVEHTAGAAEIMLHVDNTAVRTGSKLTGSGRAAIECSLSTCSPFGVYIPACSLVHHSKISSPRVWHSTI